MLGELNFDGGTHLFLNINLNVENKVVDALSQVSILFQSMSTLVIFFLTDWKINTPLIWILN